MFDKVNRLKEMLDSQRPLPPGLLKNLREVFCIEWTYNSNALEGNTLNLLETKLVVEESLSIGGKKLREHMEAVNHAEAIGFVVETVDKNEKLSKRVIKHIHYLLFKNMDNENAGKYRNYNVGISGSTHKPPEHFKVKEEMEKLFLWYETNQTILHPVELASMFHFKLLYIHPFTDGNGRTARLVMNLILMQFGYPPAIIKAKPEQRIRYYEALEKASVQSQTVKFIELVTACVEESLQHYLDALGK